MTKEREVLMSTENVNTPSTKNSEAKVKDLLKDVSNEALQNELIERNHQNTKIEIRETFQTVSKGFSGPIPPPNILHEYNTIDAGLADRIVSMAETEQKHRQMIEEKALNAAIKVEARGQNYALMIALVIIIGSVFLIYQGHEISGSVLAGGTLIGLASLFISGREKKSLHEPTKEDTK